MRSAVTTHQSRHSVRFHIQSAFCIIPVHADFHHLLGFSPWQGLYYYNSWILMGCSESCMIFETFYNALQWILTNKLSLSNVSHILDDFIFVGKQDSGQCVHSLYTLLALAKQLKVPINESKTCLPSTTKVIFRIELDAVQMQARLPQDKLSKLHDALVSTPKRKKVTLHELQSLLGFLNFACKVVTPGCCFLRRLTNLTKGST